MPLIKLLDVPHNAGGARPRSGKVISVGVPTEVTVEELVELGAFAYEVIEDETSAPAPAPEVEAPEESPTAVEAPEVSSPVNPNLPGQSG